MWSPCAKPVNTGHIRNNTQITQSRYRERRKRRRHHVTSVTKTLRLENFSVGVDTSGPGITVCTVSPLSSVCRFYLVCSDIFHHVRIVLATSVSCVLRFGPVFYCNSRIGRRCLHHHSETLAQSASPLPAQHLSSSFISVFDADRLSQRVGYVRKLLLRSAVSHITTASCFWALT